MCVGVQARLNHKGFLWDPGVCQASYMGFWIPLLGLHLTSVTVQDPGKLTQKCCQVTWVGKMASCWGHGQGGGADQHSAEWEGVEGM